MTPDPLPGVLAQLTAHHEQITQLDTRETSHHTATAERLTQITALVTAVRRLLDDHHAALTRIENLNGQDAASNDGRYRPGPAATWWKLPGAERQEPIAQLHAWIESMQTPDFALGPKYRQNPPAGLKRWEAYLEQQGLIRLENGQFVRGDGKTEERKDGTTEAYGR